jgi:hypothetical protein
MSDQLPASRPEPISPDLLRVGDAERHQAVAALGEHYAAGRLDQAEFDTRVQAAYGSRTRVDLRGLFADLPEPAPFRPEPAPGWRDGRAARDGARRSRPPVPAFPLVLLLAFVASLLLQAPIFLLVLMVWFVAARHAWHRRGPSVPFRT